MRTAIDYAEDLRQTLASGATLDEAFAELRASGASIIDCVVSVRSLRQCTIDEAKRLVGASAAWSDYRDASQEFLREISKNDHTIPPDGV